MHQDDSLCSTPKVWDGSERRGIDGIALKLMSEVRAVLEKHEEGEAKEFARIDDRLDVMGRQIAALQQSLTTYMEKTPDLVVERLETLMDEAFPEDPEFPDASPGEKRKLHRRYHANLIKAALKNIERKDSLLDKLTAHIAQNALNLIALALLAYFGLGVGK